ncbi:MAG: hypothetical protein ACI8RE_001041, partial [Ilumatobacter sp.]
MTADSETTHYPAEPTPGNQAALDSLVNLLDLEVIEVNLF